MMMSPIDPQLQDAFDGERDPATLPPDQREAYARLITAAQVLQGTPKLSVAARVMAEIRAMPQPSVLVRIVRWLTQPRAVTVRLRPAWTLALAVALAGVLFIPTGPSGTDDSFQIPDGNKGIAQFVGHFPGARSVEVVGSFNDWSLGMLPLRDENGDGIWHGAAVLPAGQHEYMFVVDGERWVPDPLAGRYVDDGFGSGRENSVLIVRPARAPQQSEGADSR